MSKTASRRNRILLVLIVLIGAAGALAYALRAERVAQRPVPGVVHETELRLAAEIGGRLAAFRVNVGQSVRRGDVLAILSTPELTAAVEEAKAALATATANRDNVFAGVRRERVDVAAEDVRIAEANLVLAQEQHTRAAALAARDFASKQRLDEAATALDKAQASLALANATYAQDKAGPTKEERASAEARVALARAALESLEAKLAKLTIVAPVDGVVRLLVAEPGEALSPGQPILTLAVGTERWATFTFREDALQGLAIGAATMLVTGAGDRLQARVTELRPLGEFAVWRAARAAGDHDVNSFLVRLDIAANAKGLEPGMTVWLERDRPPPR